MTFTIEQLESYVQAIDLYESDEAQWLRDKRLEEGGLLARVNPEMTKIVLAVDDAKTELAVNSVEIARQLISREKDLQEILKKIKWVRDHYTWAIDPELRKQPFLGRIPTEANIYDALTQILEGHND